MPKPITVSIQPQLSDYVRAHQVHRRAHRSFNALRWLFALAFLVTGTVSALGLQRYEISLLALLGAGLAFTHGFGSLWIVINHKLYKPRAPYLPHTLSFDDEGVALKREDKQGSSPWKAYGAALEGRQLFLLTVGDWDYAMIPKRAFDSAEQMQRFRNLLIKHKGQVLEIDR